MVVAHRQSAANSSVVDIVMAARSQEHGFSIKRRVTRHTPDLSCWAIFDSVKIDELSDDPVPVNDPALVAVAAAWGLSQPP